MSIESTRDLEALKRIGRVVGAVLEQLRTHVRVGVSTAALDEFCADLLRRHGARGAPRLVYNFPGAICISINDEAVHGVPGSRMVCAGDLVKLDLVAECDGYFADAAITVAVPPVSATNRQLVKCARRAFQRAFEVVQTGRRIHDVRKAIEAEVRRSGFQVIPALGGHGVGRTIHEEPSIPNYADARDTRVLTDGLVIAVEPIITSGCGGVMEADDGWTMKTIDGAMAAHHEHTLVVTRTRPIVLTAA